MTGIRGFSESNIKSMRTFYEEWRDLEANSPVTTDEIFRLPYNCILKHRLYSSYDYPSWRQNHWVDLLFFNRILRSLVVVELKKGSFKTIIGRWVLLHTRLRRNSKNCFLTRKR